MLGEEGFLGEASGSGDDEDDRMMFEAPDPVDLLLASTEVGSEAKPRPLDFVRAKLHGLKQDNKQLRARVSELEQTLSIVQTAQQWAVGKEMTQEQADKMREIKSLLEKAKKAREDMNNFSNASRAGIFDKLRVSKLALKKEREDKLIMKERLMHAFEHGRVLKEQHQQLAAQQAEERERMQKTLTSLKERHRREIGKLMGEAAIREYEAQEQYMHYGEQMAGELSNLRQHMRGVVEETVDSVAMDDGDVPCDAAVGDGKPNDPLPRPGSAPDGSAPVKEEAGGVLADGADGPRRDDSGEGDYFN